MEASIVPSHVRLCWLKHSSETSLGACSNICILLPSWSTSAKIRTRMLGVRSRAICHTADSPLGFRLLLPTAFDTKIYHSHQPRTVRHLNIRHVITERKPSKATTTKRSLPRKTVVDRHPERDATVSHDNPLDKRTSAAALHQHNRLDRINVNKWRSNLVLPPDTYWKKWKNALKDSDAGGLDTALMFVDRWKDALPKSIFHKKRHEFSDTGFIYECTSHCSLAVLGVRTVVSYGYNKVRLKLLGCHECRD